MAVLLAVTLITGFSPSDSRAEMNAITRQDGTPSSCQASRAPVLCHVQKLRTAVWELQDLMSVPRTRTSYSDRREHASRAYREWVRQLWAKRLERLQKQQTSLRWQIDRAWPQYDEWVRIGICESGHNPPNWQHNSGTYQGALGFYHGSWDQFNTFGYPSEAYQAAPLQQMRVAEAIYDRFGLSGWGCRGAAA